MGALGRWCVRHRTLAAMHLSGTVNWWLPRWLDRVLPQLPVDPPERPGPAGLPGPEAVAADAARR